MNAAVTREQFVRHEVFYYVKRCEEKASKGDPPDLLEFLNNMKAAIPVLDEETRQYLAEAPHLDVARREALFAEHCNRMVMIAAKIKTLYTLGDKVHRFNKMSSSPFDNLFILRVYGLMGSITAELAAMQQRVF